jgi:formate-dependent phosphoribosylglycinamide formyltransferase (GAR transformylase)
VTSSIPVVLFLGFRKKALETALKMGFQVIFWVEKPISQLKCYPIQHLILSPFVQVDEELKATIVDDIQKERVTAIVALTEASVVCAALLREKLNLPGHNLEISKRCNDKFLMKKFSEENGIPITPFEFLNAASEAKTLILELGLPVVIKQRNSSGGRYLALAHNEKDLEACIKPGWLAEKFIRGSEWSVESLVYEGEIIFQNITEYYRDREVNILPAGVSPEQTQRILAFNKQVIQSFGIQNGMTHLELFLCEEKIIFGEVAIRPPGGYIMDLLSIAYGFDMWEAFLKIAVGIVPDISQVPQSSAAVWVIHPGVGEVVEIAGFKNLQQLSNVRALSCKLKPGIECKTRIGSGENYGYILLEGKNRSEIIERLEELQSRISIKMRPISHKKHGIHHS